MDVLNFISWIKNGQQVTSIDPTQTLIPLGLRDPRRDDGYLSGSITAQNFINSVAPPAIVSVGNGTCSTVRTGLGNDAAGACTTVLGRSNCTAFYITDSNISGGVCNRVEGSISVVGGGCCNTINTSCGTIAGGRNNSSGGSGVFIGAGNNNSAAGQSSVIAGGSTNTVTGNCGFVGAGCFNINSGSASAIVAGLCNVASTDSNFIGAGCFNNLCNASNRSAILGGMCNTSTNADTFILGSCITSNRVCTAFVNNLSIMNIPTSSAGLPSKAVWSNAGVLTIVP
jgi:hypothetical protein